MCVKSAALDPTFVIKGRKGEEKLLPFLSNPLVKRGLMFKTESNYATI